MTDVTPRGVRNNNPGNLRKNDTKWQGLASAQSDPSFFVFKDPTYGIRAIARTLITYQDQYNLKTVRALISRWAPPVENDTTSYVNAVAYPNGTLEVGTGPDLQRDMHKYDDLRMLVVGIITHENGQQPYTAAQIDKGLLMAGVQPPKKSLAISGQVIGGSVAATSTVLGPLIPTAYTQIQAVQDQISPYADTFKWVKVILVVLALAGTALVIYAKWDERRKGIS